MPKGEHWIQDIIGSKGNICLTYCIIVCVICDFLKGNKDFHSCIEFMDDVTL